MLESMTLVSRGGVILYQHVASPSLVGANESVTRQGLAQLLAGRIAKQQAHEQTKPAFTIVNNLSYVWVSVKAESNDAAASTTTTTSAPSNTLDYIAIISYPDIMFEGPREYLRKWAEALLQATIKTYNQYYISSTEMNNISLFLRSDPAPFDKLFQFLLTESKTKNSATTGSNESSHVTSNATTKSNSSKATSSGKENRHWVNMDAKVSAQDMAQLDQSQKAGGGNSGNDTNNISAALEEAKLAFLPTAQDLANDGKEDAFMNKINKDEPASWSSSITGVFSQLVGTKILQDSDLVAPLKAMEQRLTTQNVSQEVAAKLCANVKQALLGQRLTSWSRVQTAVQQALEASLRHVLSVSAQKQQHVDLLRNVLAHKRNATSMFSLTSRQKQAQKPYIIIVQGINGIGKTTTLAKLAYYLSTNGCKPLLVAGDTFRSGAVEQLQVHADCLQVPLFAQGYSKDPSSVVKAAVQHAVKQGNDVVLVDTAGRMQNNVPLMRALAKLVEENEPNFIIQVCEALVGHDGLSQFQTFQKALGSRGTDGLILTKFDTVGDKVGAAVTLVYETGTPIVFTGTGQKYHHLKPMSVTGVIQSLLSG
ncbi:hypothetical protein MPSEU_000971600 [Mayamaea pseudoterrestris]|nr:hypothetical protein MPSEU_000971600 [Mayamaea pseudoterrestris]